jgi:pilus assembly protein CpaE
MTTTSLRKIHLLILHSGHIRPAAEADNATRTADMLRSDSRFQTTVMVAGFAQASRTALALRPDVILLDGVLGDPVDVISELDEALGDLPVIVLLDEADRDRVHACVVAGARGCLLRPVDAETLIGTIVQVTAKARRRRKTESDNPSDGAQRGQLIAVRGAKGGVGATLIATNLALAIKRRAGESMALVDGHFFGGDVSVMLDVAPTRTIADLIPHLDRLDDDLIASTMREHASGVAVLAAPNEFEQAESIRPDDFQRVLDALRTRYAYVVVDCSPFLDQNSIAVLDMADTVLLVATPDVPALKNAARFVQLASQLGYARNKLRLVINRFNAPGALSPSDFEGHLEYVTSFRIPNERNVAGPLTYGQPLMTARKGGPAARALDRLGRTIIAGEGWDGEPRRGPARRLGLPKWWRGERSQMMHSARVAEAV